MYENHIMLVGTFIMIMYLMICQTILFIFRQLILFTHNKLMHLTAANNLFAYPSTTHLCMRIYVQWQHCQAKM